MAIIHGDCLEQLQKLADDSIDFICTDPPYGYSFMGKEWDKAVPSVAIWRECLRVLKPGAFMCVMSAPRSDVQCAMIARLQEAGFRLDFTPIYWTYASGFPKAGNIGKLVDKRLGAEREIVQRTRIDGKGTGYADSSSATSPNIMPSREPITDAAKALDGSYAGFQPKPAVEVIIIAMKPLSEKTYVDQALTNGKGISWLDDGRMPFASQEDMTSNGFIQTGRGSKVLGDDGIMVGCDPGEVYQQNQTGRFPANLLVSDDVLNDGTVSKSSSGITVSSPTAMGQGNGWNDHENRPVEFQNYGDSGSYSRYFDLDKWAQTLPFLAVPKASKGEKGADNKHPTVKPLKLMSYLITIFSRPGDTVLDPFVGSGTTCLAAQKLGREPIGIEREAEYVEIAKARLEAEPQQLTLAA